jgi:hypothetical protein
MGCSTEPHHERPEIHRPAIVGNPVFAANAVRILARGVGGNVETMGIRLLGGRAFTDLDGPTDGLLAVIVNEMLPQRYRCKAEPLGKRISHRHHNALWMRVVGVVRDVKHYGVHVPMIPGLYLPYAQVPLGQMAIMVRTSGSPLSLVPLVRSTRRDASPTSAGGDTWLTLARKQEWMPEVGFCVRLVACW